MSEWGVMWQAVSVILTFGISCVGVYKVVQELRRLNEQRAKDAHDKETASLLKRVEFFLAQHRRLFDNPELYGVLCLLDSDDVELARPDMADKKRKFLTFVEEIALLVNTKQIDADVAHYMFGYYAACARHGANFSEGLALERQYWRLFYDFTDAAEAFLERNPDGPAKLSL
jgi:hypothetical protein